MGGKGSVIKAEMVFSSTSRLILLFPSNCSLCCSMHHVMGIQYCSLCTVCIMSWASNWREGGVEGGRGVNHPCSHMMDEFLNLNINSSTCTVNFITFKNILL